MKSVDSNRTLPRETHLFVRQDPEELTGPLGFYHFLFGEYSGSLRGNKPQQDVSQIFTLAAGLHLCREGFFGFVTNRCSLIIRQGLV